MKRRKQTAAADDPRLAAGTQSLIDVIAPGVVEVQRDHVLIDGQVSRILYVRAFPSSVYPGWLGPLIDFDEPVELSIHLAPVESAKTIGWLDRQIARFTSSRNVSARQGYIADSEREVAYEQHVALRDALQRGHEKMYQVGTYLVLRAATLEALDAATARVQGILAGMQLSVRIAYWEQDKGFRSGSPLAQDELGDVINLNSRAAAGLFPLSSASVAMEDGWFYGTDGLTHGPVLHVVKRQLRGTRRAVDAHPEAGPTLNVRRLEIGGEAQPLAAVALGSEVLQERAEMLGIVHRGANERARRARMGDGRIDAHLVVLRPVPGGGPAGRRRRSGAPGRRRLRAPVCPCAAGARRLPLPLQAADGPAQQGFRRPPQLDHAVTPAFQVRQEFLLGGPLAARGR